MLSTVDRMMCSISKCCTLNLHLLDQELPVLVGWACPVVSPPPPQVGSTRPCWRGDNNHTYTMLHRCNNPPRDFLRLRPGPVLGFTRATHSLMNGRRWRHKHGGWAFLRMQGNHLSNNHNNITRSMSLVFQAGWHLKGLMVHSNRQQELSSQKLPNPWNSTMLSTT